MLLLKTNIMRQRIFGVENKLIKKGGLSMYQLRRYFEESNNKAYQLLREPGMDISIHWLSPLLYKWEKRLCPEKVL